MHGPTNLRDTLPLTVLVTPHQHLCVASLETCCACLVMVQMNFMNAPLIFCTLCTCIWWASAASLDSSVLHWASYVIATLMKGFAHKSTKPSGCVCCGHPMYTLWSLNYWWGRYHALLSVPHGRITAKWVSHFCIHSIIAWQLFHLNSVSLVTLMFFYSVSQPCQGLHVATLFCGNRLVICSSYSYSYWALYIWYLMRWRQVHFTPTVHQL